MFGCTKKKGERNVEIPDKMRSSSRHPLLAACSCQPSYCVQVVSLLADTVLVAHYMHSCRCFISFYLSRSSSSAKPRSAKKKSPGRSRGDSCVVLTWVEKNTPVLEHETKTPFFAGIRGS